MKVDGKFQLMNAPVCGSRLNLCDVFDGIRVNIEAVLIICKVCYKARIIILFFILF